MSRNEDDVFMAYVNEIAFLGAIAAVILWVMIILSSFFASFGASDSTGMNPQAIDDRLKAIEVVAVKGTPEPAATTAASADVPAADTSEAAPEADAGAIDANAIVTATCFACHSIGLLESPKIGDKEAWDKRIEANGGLDGLVKSAIVGKGAMPARGGNAALTDAEVKAAVEFMMQ